MNGPGPLLLGGRVPGPFEHSSVTLGHIDAGPRAEWPTEAVRRAPLCLRVSVVQQFTQRRAQSSAILRVSAPSAVTQFSQQDQRRLAFALDAAGPPVQITIAPQSLSSDLKSIGVVALRA